MIHSALGRIRIIDVKPKSRLDDPETAAVFHWTDDVCGQKGWDYEVWSGTSETTLRNVKLLACARPSEHLDRQTAMRAINACIEPLAFAYLVMVLSTSADDELVVRPVMLRLLWWGILTVDMEARITERTSLALGNEETGEFNP